MKYCKIGFAFIIFSLFLAGIVYRCVLCASPLWEEFLGLALTLLISSAMLAFVRYSGIKTLYWVERTSLPLIAMGGGLACLIIDGSISDLFLIFFAVGSAQPVYHAENRGIPGIWNSLLPAVVASILCQAVHYSGNILLLIWIPISITVFSACLSAWYSPHRIRDAAVCIGLLALFAGVVLAIMIRVGSFDLEIAGLLRCLHPEQDPLRSGFPLLAARETMRTSVAAGTNHRLCPEIWSFLAQDTELWQLTRMVTHWGYLAGLLVLVLSAVFLLFGILLCRHKPQESRWPSVAALTLLTSHIAFYLLQNMGWTIWYVARFPFFSSSASWNAICLFLAGLIFMKWNVRYPPLKLLYGSQKNGHPQRHIA